MPQRVNSFIDQYRNDDSYKRLVKNETMFKCEKFSELYYKTFSQINEVAKGRNSLKELTYQIRETEQGNESNLLKYLEHLILDNHNYEFIIPYYFISSEINHPLENEISLHHNHHFGALGTIKDILSDIN
jgi:hypothetical protein